MAGLLVLLVLSSLLDPAPLDLNAASVSDLERLPGIGESKAAAIVEHRRAFGPFLEMTDLLDVPGIGEATLATLEGLVTVVPSPGISALSDTTHWLSEGGLADTLLTVAFLDVGQGDAILLAAEGGQTWLVDGGPDEGGPVLPAVVLRLMEAGFASLDIVALSHPHEDHIGGLDDVIGMFSPRKLLDPGLDFYSPVYEQLLRVALERGLEYELLCHRDTFELSDSVELVVMTASGRSGAAGLDANELGAVMLVSCGRASLLLTGDVGEAAERLIFEDMGPVTVLKVPHHGSVGSLFAPFFRRLRPQYSIISVGRDNPFGHPHPDVVGLLEQLSSTVLRTDRAGTIFVRTDGSRIEITTSEM
ncbi:helix-hairpin-helix domain-containing protein [Candidatus Fermentibacterales bacterium]|nr:helix-hairpin-helix domain-containing protein [Candidatus Fermentibacterales bacterium]